MLDSDASDNPPFDDDEMEDLSDSNFGSDRVWEEDDGAWWTDFPPPDGFAGEERGAWGDVDYARECSEDECDVLDAAREVELSDLKAEEEAERNAFFTDLREGLDSDRHAELVSASIPARIVSGEQASAEMESRGTDDEVDPEPSSG